MFARLHAILLCGVAAFVVLPTSSAVGAVKLPAAIGENMVLQQQQPIPIWGWDDPDTTITVELGDMKETAQTGNDGAWSVKLPAMSAGGPHVLIITGNNTISLNNVYVGEVWLCGGQSNMERPVSSSNNAKQEIAAANHPEIRHIKISRSAAAKPQSDVESSGWRRCTPESVGEFTAVGYYFARHIQGELDVPVGLINSNWGGTPIEPWIPPIGFKEVPALRKFADNLENYPARHGKQIHYRSPLALYNGMRYLA